MEMVHFIPSSQRKLAILAAEADLAPALIYGGSGSGKSSIARWMHDHGPRAQRIFLVGGHHRPLVDQILESQSGTLMIPELGELTLSEQKILLGFLKTKSVPHASPYPALSQVSAQSSTDTVIADVRIIGTTSQALEGRAQGGLFNIELLEKMNVFRIEMPPLGKRMDEFDDIVLIITREITQELQREDVKNLSPATWERLRSYDWPGNLRELRNVLRCAVASCKVDQIEISDLPEFGFTRIDFRATREQFEKIYILDLLKTFNWEIDKTCRMTRIDKNVLLAKIKHYGITLDR